MNFVVKTKPSRWKTTSKTVALNSGSRNWLAQFPNQAQHEFTETGSVGGSSTRSGRTTQPATTTCNSLLYDASADASLVIVALSVGRGHASTEIGLACMDAHSPTLTLSQFSDDMTFGGLMVALNLYAPSHILLHNTVFDAQPTAPVLLAIRRTFPHIEIVSVDRSRFNSQRGAAMLLTLCMAKHTDQLRANMKQYYALTSAAALLDHMQASVVRAPFGEHSLAVRFAVPTGSMHVDVESAHRLELLYPLYPSGQRHTSLYGVLNECRTHIGQRTLRARILQPSCDAKRIGAIHECVEECRLKETTLAALHQLLGRFVAVDRLIRIAYRLPQVREDNFRTAEVLINQALQLKMCLDGVPELFRVLSDLESGCFAELRCGLQDERYPWLSQKIHAVLGPESAISAGSGGGGAQFFQRLHAVRTGLNGMLDLNRTIYTALLADINAEVDRLRQEYGLPLRLMYSKGRSFHVQVLLRKNLIVERIAQEMDVLHRSRTTMLLSNEPLRNLNIRIDKYIHEIHYVSTAIIGNLLQEIRNEIEAIYDLTSVIAELDILVSLVKVSLGSDYCRPTFGDDMRIVQATHPFAAAANATATAVAVPNNVLATFEYNFFIITGPNMSGKTIYLKMIALLQVMAQVGCYVPARSAEFRLCDRLFTRMGFNDSIVQNASSFVLEVREMNYILRNVTANSLLIIDELCRSTNATEGERIATRVCEQLLNVHGRRDGTANGDGGGLETMRSGGGSRAFGRMTAPFVFFTTHFPAICRLIDGHLNVVNLNFNVSESLDAHQKLHLTYTHQLEEGHTVTTGYGLALARTVRFPRSLLLRAERLIAAEWSGRTATATQRSVVSSHRNSNRSILSNPVNRSYRRSSHSVEQQPQDEAAAAVGTVISHLERCVYDLYANIIEVFKSDSDTVDDDDLAGQVNGKIEEFLNACTDEDTHTLRSLDCASIMRTFRTLINRDEQVVRRQERFPSAGSNNSLRSQWFPAHNQPAAILQNPTTNLSFGSTIRDQDKTPTASGTSLSKLSFHSLLRRFVPEPKPQVRGRVNDSVSLPSIDSPYVLSQPSAESMDANELNAVASTSSGRREMCGFENMPIVFWTSVNEFENGPEHDELRTYINDGLQTTTRTHRPETSVARKRAADFTYLAVHPEEVKIARHSETSSSERRVRFADEFSFMGSPMATEFRSNARPASPLFPADNALADMNDLFEMSQANVDDDVTPISPSIRRPNANANDWSAIFSDDSPMPNINIQPFLASPKTERQQARALLPSLDKSAVCQTPGLSRGYGVDNGPEQSQEITSSTTLSSQQAVFLPTFTQIETEIGLPFVSSQSAGEESATTKVCDEIPPPKTPAQALGDNDVDLLIPAPEGY